MTTANQVLAQAKRFSGQRYVFGAEGDTKSDDWVGPVDCSELVQIACKRAGVTPTMPDGAYWQWLHTRQHRISIAEAYRTPGALLFIGDGTGTGRDAITHVGFSLGNNTTFEARGKAWPVGVFQYRTGWTFAAIIPGVDYTNTNTTPAQPDEDDDQMPLKIDDARATVDNLYRGVLGREPDRGPSGQPNKGPAEDWAYQFTIRPSIVVLSEFFAAAAQEIHANDRGVADMLNALDSRQRATTTRIDQLANTGGSVDLAKLRIVATS